MVGHSLRIGLIGPLPPPSGGMANQTLQLARLLREEGHQVDIVQVNAPYSPPWIGKIKGIRALCRLIPYVRRLWKVAGQVEIFHVMANSGLSWHLFAAPAVWIARMRGVPVVINYRGGEAEAFFSKAFAWVRPTLAQAAAITVPSTFLVEIFRKRHVSTLVVPNIIDLSRFQPKPIREQEACMTAPVILVTRNLEAIYDNATAIRAFVEIKRVWPKAQLIIAGSGPELERLQALGAELGVERHIVFTGRVENKEMSRLYQEADVVLNPSLADNMPNSLLEALASGVPVVSTNVGGIPHMVRHEETALLVPPGEPLSMAQATLRLLADRATANKICVAGLECAAQYTWPKVRERLLQVYHDVLRSDQILLESRK